MDPGGTELQAQTGHFVVSPQTSIPRPRIMSKVMRAENKDEWNYIVGVQWLNSRDLDKAQTFLEKAFVQ